MISNRLQTLIETAILAALAFIFDILPSIDIGPYISISFAMVPIFILAFRWGLKYAIFGGFLWGMLQIILGDLQPVHWIQVIVEYPLAFASIGLAGLFMAAIQQKFKDGEKISGSFLIILATLVGSLARYIWHYFAGIIFWAEYAPENQPVWIYSLVVNGIAGLGSFIFCSIVLILLLSLSTRLLTANRRVAN